MSDYLMHEEVPLSILDFLDHRPEPKNLWVGDYESIYPRHRVSLDHLGIDVWRFHILLFCDLVSLLRMNWLNQRIRKLLNTHEFVVEYQTSCWYLQPRYCRCSRNVFYIDLPRFLDFAHDYAGIEGSADFPEIHNVQDASLFLRKIGRTPDMLTQSLQRSGLPPTRPPLRVTNLIPQTSKAFKDGFTKMWTDSCIVPMPRCMSRPVEQRRITPLALSRERLATETLAEFEYRSFWREFHEVTDDMVDAVVEGREPTNVPVDDGYGPVDVDLLEEWFTHCKSVGANPYDPCYDDELCRGFRCVRWARQKMYDSALGGTSYPMHLCLHREDLTRAASRLGTDYIDRMYVHLNRYRGGEPDWNVLDLRGVLYFMGVRYEHADEDFSVWALHTQAMLHGVYAHMWLDAIGNWTRLLLQHLSHTATQIEDDMPFSALQRRWKFLHSLCFAGPSILPSTRTYDRVERDRDQKAIHTIFNGYHLEENRFLSSIVDTGDLWTNEGDLAHRSRHYLSSLLEQYTNPVPNHRTETQRVHDAQRLIKFAEYLTDFAEYVASPRVDERTNVTRRRCLQIYLASYMSLVMFSPAWKRTYHWKPSRTNEQTHWHIPHLNLQHNHRYVRYLNYCNARTLFYHPNPYDLLSNVDGDATTGWRG